MRRTTMLISDRRPDALRWPTALARRVDADGVPTAQVTVVLLDDATATARDSHPEAGRLDALLDAGAEVLVDVGALRRRGMAGGDVRAGVKVTDLDAIGDLLVDATDKVVWL